MAAAAAAAYDPPVDPPLKAKAAYTIVGKPIARFDIPAKVDGSAKYGIDVRLPNMSYAVIAASPVFGGTLASVDEAPAKAMRGVKKVVKLPAAVAVVADNTWRAKEALAALAPVWSEGANANVTSKSIFAGMDAALDKGEFEPTIALATSTRRLRLRSEWSRRLSRAVSGARDDGSDELHGAIRERQADGVGRVPRRARRAGGGGEVRGHADRRRHAASHGDGRRLRAARVDVRTISSKAIGVARQVEGPVQVVFTREEDMTQDYYRHASVARMKAALDDNGKVTAWLHTFTEKHDPPEATIA